MLDDLFSHKIHATDLEEWGKTLVRLANVYQQLDGRLFDKEEMRNRLDRLAPTAARDPFRASILHLHVDSRSRPDRLGTERMASSTK